MIRILIVDDERTARKGLYFTLRTQIDEILEAESTEQAEKLLQSYNIDLAIVDLRVPTEDHGIGLVKYIKENYSLIPVLVMTAFGSVQSAVRAIKSGAQDYITKDFSKDEIIVKIEKLIEIRKLWLANLRLSHEVKDLKEKYSLADKSTEIVGDSPEIKNILNLVSRISKDKDTTVLITGESGTGKELIARSIHYNSPERKDNEFVVVDISNMPPTLLESQLFGHEKGSFTNAQEQRIGLFEQANKGTIFLDEIGDFPLELQIKLLRFLQEKAFMRVGGDTLFHSDVRIIAATNKNLEKMVKQNLFREDLFYRLNVIRLHLPALRERKEDIPVLMKYYQKQIEDKKNTRLVFPENIIEKMKSYDWPGNIRQLKNIIESLYIICPGSEVKNEDLIFDNSLIKPNENNLFRSLFNYPLKNARNKIIAKFEKEFLIHHLYLHNGNISKIATAVGESREGLSKKITKYGIKK
jgi:DNA-binding NtrC family response regulator